MDLRQTMQQATRREQIMDTCLDMARWAFRRQTEIAEALCYWCALSWAITLCSPAALESSTSYRAMSTIALAVQRRTGIGGPDEGPWATAFYGIVLVLTLAYLLTIWGVFGVYPLGEYHPPPWQFTVARRLRILALIALAMLLAFITYALWVANPIGTGFRIYGAFAATSLWSAAFIAWRYGRVVLPGGGRWMTGRSR
ncbi:MAG: hypothetical protein ABIR11_03560 [Candidatus Limnocylindrales bacterium]